MWNMLKKYIVYVIIVPACKKIMVANFPKLRKHINPYFQEHLHADTMQEGCKENHTWKPKAKRKTFKAAREIRLIFKGQLEFIGSKFMTLAMQKLDKRL